MGLAVKDFRASLQSQSDYGIAFRDFARDYNRRGFNCLDCSPMGCVRDEIDIDHLMSYLCIGINKIIPRSKSTLLCTMIPVQSCLKQWRTQDFI